MYRPGEELIVTSAYAHPDDELPGGFVFRVLQTLDWDTPHDELVWVRGCALLPPQGLPSVERTLLLPISLARRPGVVYGDATPPALVRQYVSPRWLQISGQTSPDGVS